MNISRNQRFACLAVLALFAPAILSQAEPAETQPAASQPNPAPKQEGVSVVILGDSLALCGFGKRLDERFRKSPQFKATFTYIACGTTPLSWLKERPYANIKTHCGFVSIESDGSGRPRELQDVYGMRRGHIPIPHPVPKLEDLLATLHPDILVMQTGTNLFDLFPDRKTVSPHRHGPALRSYLVPFVSKASQSPSTLKKLYWVSPPISGRVSKEIQDFVIQQLRTDIGGVANIIDSRTLVPYPYQHMEPDKEHFIGAEMDLWADRVFDVVERDLASQPLSSLKPLSDKAPAVAEVAQEPAPPAEKPTNEILKVKAKLIFKTEPIPINELLPYQEYLVGYVYEINKLIAGQYTESQILVMHPAYIGLKKQKLRYHVGKTYKLQLHELENTLWKTVKSKDDSGLINLQPYIRIQDETRHPEHAH
ncbi:MAG: hypothetical protein DMF06_10815 [Verrucomicrobia bacterium]|nr:MAG: hypothetical protein DMF06_10815 [Verrucomicrobiota bacterium]